MTSVLLGQIVRIFYKENSPPRGSSRGIKAYEASYFHLAGVSPCASAASSGSGDSVG